MPINNAFGEWGQGAAPSALDGPRSVSPSPSPSGGGVLPGPMPSTGGGSGGGGASMAHGALDNSGGGGYPSAGGGGASDGSGASVAQGFDDGGDVGDTEDGAVGAAQGADAATMDPMQAITKTLAYGRKKFGLPQNFSNPSSGQQSFDDGGVVQTGNDQGQGEPPLPDPRQALQYLTGAGNLSPDIAGALEKHVDPQGTMSPAQRALTAISAAPSPDAAFGMMQHYRTRYNAYSGGAKAALDQGNVAQAAVHATQAMSAVPTGYDVRFAPTKGGVAMSAKKIGGQPQQQAMDDGGEVEDQYAGLPESENVEDRRDEGAGNKSADVMDSYTSKSEANTRPYENRSRNKQRGKALDQEQSFADGGEVDDEEDQGVIPDQPQDDVSETDDTAGAGPGGQAPQGSDGSEVPTVLTADQFKQMMSAGYDKPLDQGWGAFLRGIVQGRMSDVVQQPARQQQAQTGTKTTTGTNPDVMAAASATNAEAGGDAASAGAPAPDQQPGGVAMAGAAGGAPQGAGAPDGGAGRQQRGPRLDEYQQRIEAQANKLFRPNGWHQEGSPQEERRQQYIAKMMEGAMGSEFKQDQETGRNRGMLEQIRQQGRQTLQTQKDTATKDRLEITEAGRTARNGLTNFTKVNVAQAKNLYSQLAGQQREQVRMIGQILSANPNMKPPQVWQVVQQQSKQIGIDPQAVAGMLAHNVDQPPQQQQPPAQGGEGGGQEGGEEQYVVYPSGPYAGKLMKKLPNGRVVPVPGQQ